MDVLAGHGLDDIIKDSNTGTNRHFTPRFLGVKDLVPVKFYTGIEPIGEGGRRGNSVEFPRQRDRRWSVDE